MTNLRTPAPFGATRLATLMALGLCLTSLASSPAQAQNLLDLFESARTFDAALQGAKAQLDANQYKAEGARAGLLPKLALTAAVNASNLVISPDAGPKSDRGFGALSTGLNASQSLYGPVNQLVYDLGKKSLDQAQAQLELVEQDLVVRVSQAYFDVLASQDSLAFVLAQKAAVAEQLASAKRNFEVGTSTITDTREAQARYDLVIAQQIAAENDLLVKGLTLDQVVGKLNLKPKAVALPLVLPVLKPDDVNTWVQRAHDGHPSVQLAQVALDIAVLETARARAAEKPTLDLVGNYGITRNEGGSSSSAVGSWVTSATIGVNFNLPLYTGNSLQNRIKETLALEDKARNDLDAAKRLVAQATRATYYGLISGQGQVKAFEAAEASSQSALDANKLGYQVGVRINIDVLNAQSQLFQTKRDLAKARYDVLLAGLKLRQASGSLQPNDLLGINGLLVK